MTLTSVKISFTNENNQHLTTSLFILDVDRADVFLILLTYGKCRKILHFEA